jgi:hypothetical protein
MREDEIIAQLRNRLLAATPSSVDVRTSGRDEAPEPPEVIIDWRTMRLENESGHRSRIATVRDNSGDAIGDEYHAFFRFEAECTVRFYDEIDRDQIIDDIEKALLPLESFPERFNRDTTEWQVGASSRSINSMVERDWAEAVLLVNCKYVKKAQETGGDVIETINTDIELDETIDETTSDTES